MCNCLEEKVEGIKKAHQAEKVRFLDVEGYSGQLYTRIEVTKNGKPEKMNMFMTYCPYCGQPYNKKERMD